MGDRTEVLVVGLGRFGSAVAGTLAELGHDVTGVDVSPALVQAAARLVGNVVQADATDIEAMRQLGAGDFRQAVVAIGADVEASVLATSVLLELGIARVWAKAITARHGQILERIGAHRVVFPEHEMGVRVAHALTGRTLEYIELGPDLALAETTPPRTLVGRTLAEAGVRRRHDVTVVGVRSPGGAVQPATADTRVGEGDQLLVMGATARVERFCELE